jgi:hypothetical protein
MTILTPRRSMNSSWSFYWPSLTLTRIFQSFIIHPTGSNNGKSYRLALCVSLGIGTLTGLNHERYLRTPGPLAMHLHSASASIRQ